MTLVGVWASCGLGQSLWCKMHSSRQAEASWQLCGEETSKIGLLAQIYRAAGSPVSIVSSVYMITVVDRLACFYVDEEAAYV